MKLSDICKYRSEKIELSNIDESEYISTDNMLPNFAGIGELKSFPKVGKVNKYYKNDILLSNIRPYFKKMILSETESGCSTDVLVIEVIDNQVNPKFLYYRLRNDDFFNYVILTSKGTKMPRGDKTAIMNFEIRVPVIKFQNKIVKILDDIDKKIQLNNQINNNLYEMGDILYYEFFGKYKDNLPEEYRITKLNEVADNFDSKRKPMSSREREQHQGKYPYYGATSIIGYVDNYIFDGTYLLMGEDGTVKTNEGYPVLQYIWDKNWINNHAHVLKGSKISTELLMFALRKINIENIITGAVQPKINQENMNKIEFVIGNDSKNKELEELLSNLMNKSKNIIEENRRLEQLMDTLLPKLMNGEIDLDNIEI